MNPTTAVESDIECLMVRVVNIQKVLYIQCRTAHQCEINTTPSKLNSVTFKIQFSTKNQRKMLCSQLNM